MTKNLYKLGWLLHPEWDLVVSLSVKLSVTVYLIVFALALVLGSFVCTLPLLLLSRSPRSLGQGA